MKTLYAPLVLTGLLLTSSVLTAQEATVGVDTVRADVSAIAMQMDAKNTAVLAILQKLTICNARGMFYRPDVAGADADDCVGPSATSSALTTVGTLRANVGRGGKTVGPLSADFCTLTNTSTSVLLET